nr:SIR2 family protein [Pectobacterium brasiliense]
MSPSWIITTNYDMVIENLLIGKSIPLGPNDSLSSPKGLIPVYHLHGLRTNPESIIITQEDYISLFRPNEYRQIKLALTIKESTTLLIGYGLGDVNVLTALDWSRNVFKGEKENYPNDIIQVLRKSAPKDEPYRDKNGIVIIETDDISNFFEEYDKVKSSESKIRDKRKNTLKEFEHILINPDQEAIDKFIDDSKIRKDTLQVLSKFPIYLIYGFISFLGKCIDETWKRALPKGAFEAYNQNLIIILDILIAFQIDRFPPALFQTIVYSLHRIGPYIGKSHGQCWAAQETWDKRKKEFSPELIKELENISAQHDYYHVKKLIGK